MAVRNAMASPEINVHGKVYNLWPKGSASADDQIKDAVAGIQIATELFLERLSSELPQEDLRMQLMAFNLRMWNSMRSEAERQGFRKAVRMWFRLLGFSSDDCAAGIGEFNDAVFLATT